MNNPSRFAPIAPIVLCALLVACGKPAANPDGDTAAPAAAETPAASAPEAAAPAPASEPSAQPASESSPEPTEEQRELAEKQAKLDYSIMENRYLNDPRGQWASAATASSTFGSSYTASQMQGVVDGENWKNNNQTLGFDSAELSFDKAVAATEVRLVMPYGHGVEAITQLDLRDPDGNWHTVWSGISEIKRDERGPRTWFVRQFEKTAYPVNAVKITIANNLDANYKDIDAVQLIGD